MPKNWDTYSRQGLDLASAAASFGFSAAKTGTKLGFAVTRGIASTAVGITTSVVDHTLFGGLTVTRPVVGGAVSTVLSLAEQITLAPIHLSEYITATSLLAAHSSINVLSVIFPGSSEASFSLASFITLVKREWSDPAHGDSLPSKQYGITQVGRAIVAWVALQGVTQEWQEKRWMKHLRELTVNDPQKNFDSTRMRKGSRIRVTSDVIFPDNRSHIITADIGVAPYRAQTIFSNNKASTFRTKPPVLQVNGASMTPRHLPIAELKTTLRRLSKMVLAGYGGASLLFFGVPLTSAASSSPQAKAEEAQLAKAINASEAEAAGDQPELSTTEVEYSWWDVLLGRHDHEIFEKFAQAPNEKMKADIKIGREHLMPRFWVLTDHSRSQVVLVLRGTMSLNEIAVDLTCESEEFVPATSEISEELESPIPGQFVFPTRSRQPSTASSAPVHYMVHSGMLRMARAMGEVGKPVQLAVHEALYQNPGYGAIRDLRNAAVWLCDANESEQETGSGYTAVTARARQWKAGNGSPEDPEWFIAVRKTLEANMQMAHTFPPGRVLWALRESDLHPSHRTDDPEKSSSNGLAVDKLRLFEVLDVEKVFSQIVFAKDMLGVVEDLSPQGCRMSWMSPSYVVQSFDASWTPLARRYSLYLYREVGWESNEIHKGVPVLFIPGNAGSSRQVRSIASSAARQYFSQPYSVSNDFSSRGVRPLDVFAVEFNEDLSAFHGPTLEAQTEYTSQAIQYILSLYPTNTQIIIMGHSMGGIVATSLLPSDNISTIITMSTPHILPPARFDQRIDAIYERNQHVLASDATPILSLCGGATDMMIPSESCILPVSDTNKPYRRTVFSSALEGAWTGVGHREMVWCHQVRWRVARAALELSKANLVSEKEKVLDLWLRDGHALPPREDPLQHSSNGDEEFVSHGQALTLRNPRESKKYRFPISTSYSNHFVLFVSQGSIPPVSPQHPNSLQVDVQLCSKPQDAFECRPLVPATHKLIPNPISGESFPMPDGGSDESEGVVLFEADVSSYDGLWVSVNLDKASGDGWVVGGFSSNKKIVNNISIYGLLLNTATILIPDYATLRTDVIFPNLAEHALLVYRVIPIRQSSQSDALLHPLLAHTSHPSETHYFPLALPRPRRLLLHTHGAAPYIRSRNSSSLEVTIYSSDAPGQLKGLHLDIDWMGTFGRWSSRYLTTLLCWAVGIVSLILFEILSIGDHGAAIPSVSRSLETFGRRTYPKLLIASFVISFIPLPEEYYLGNAGTYVFAPIAPILLTMATGLVCVSWALLNVLMWPMEKIGRLFASRQRVDVKRARRSILLSMGLLFALIFFFIPWQVAYLSCWLIHLYTCATIQPLVDHDSSIPLLARDEGEDENATERRRSELVQQRVVQENNKNSNSHMLLFMTWLLPLAAPVLVVWVRTLVTAGLTTPFDGDHFFLNVAPFLVVVDFASWNRNTLMYPRSSWERYTSVKWTFFVAASVAFFVGPRWAYHVFDVGRIAVGALVVLRIGPRYWGGSWS
ncbi:GPI inositol deacylase [Marasmius crinis-equi]|uniref:GPI inositol-deacylase n=1 Tax=Marasmius crinis-equi TaxID=585013 RepID=A0ABR3FQV0_9AGAR